MGKWCELMENKLTIRMAVCLCLAMCIQRLSMAVGNVFFVLTIILFLILVYKGHKSNRLEPDDEILGYYKTFAFFLLTVIPSVLFSSNLLFSFKTFNEMWIYRVIPFFAITLFLKNKEVLMKMLMAFIVVTSIDSLVALAQVFFNMSSRGWGFGGNTLNLAALLCMVIPITIVIASDDRFESKYRKIACGALVCFFIGLLAGQSRGAWLTVAILAPIVSWKYLMQNKKILVVACLLAVTIVGFFVSSPRYLHRLESVTNMTTDRSNADRLIVWQSGWNMIKDHPIAGVGLGNFREYYLKAYKLPEVTQNLSHTHNNLMQICVEAGFLGLIGWVYLSGYIFIKNFRAWYRDNDQYALMLWSSWGGFIIFGMIDLIADASAVMKSWWFLLGILLMLKLSNKKTEA